VWLHVAEHAHAYATTWWAGSWPLDTPDLDQCDNPAFRAANPGLCDPSGLFPRIGGGQPGGGGSGGGILSRILHAIGL